MGNVEGHGDGIGGGIALRERGGLAIEQRQALTHAFQCIRSAADTVRRRAAEGEHDAQAAIARMRDELGEPVPALVVSGDLRAGTAREVREAGFLLLAKPVVPASLEAAASTLVASRDHAENLPAPMPW